MLSLSFCACVCQHINLIFIFSVSVCVSVCVFLCVCVELSYRMRYAATAICNAINFMQAIFLIGIRGGGGGNGITGAGDSTIAAVLFEYALSGRQTI